MEEKLKARATFLGLGLASLAMWGAYGYDPKFDVIRAPMTMAKGEHSVDQFTIAFVDMTDSGGRLSMAWDTTVAIVGFSFAQ
jgi:hypothetical protein